MGTIQLKNNWMVEGFSRGIGLDRGVHRATYKPASAVPAKIPGTIRRALLNAGLIPDPYFGDNAEKSLWVEDMEWWFTTRFPVPREHRDQYLTLEIQGINYSGEVYLNGELLGEPVGMFNPAVYDVSESLRFSGENYLAVRLEAPPDSRTVGILNGRAIEEPYKQLYSIAQFCFGWDWAPHMVPIGIWRPVLLQSTGRGRLRHPRVVTRITGESSARIELSVDIQNLSGQDGGYDLEGRISGEGFNIKPISFQLDRTVGSGESELVETAINISPARFWWPHTMGDQPLYRLELTLTAPDGAVSHRIDQVFGIREIEMTANEGADEIIRKELENETGDVPAVYSMGRVAKSYPWTFVVNGRRMYAVGSNWVPVDSMLDLNRDRYEHLIRLAEDAGMNLLRVWGGGLYETDDFYDICNRRGILTWQEFLSNRNVGRIDRPRLLEGVREAILRLRNNPSLALWCGGNEFDPDDKSSRELVDELSEVVAELDPDRDFHRASPYMGDDHYWGVWHRREPYTAYRRVRPFRSEAGLSAPPGVENMRRFIPEADLWPYNRDMWEYHGERIPKRGHMGKQDYYVNEYGPAVSLADYVRKAQLSQAIGNQFNLEFCRRNKYANSGVLIWQYNDCWPALSWSQVDWYGRPKPSYYHLKRAARPLHLTADYSRYRWEPGEQFRASLHLINDRPDPVDGLKCRAVLFDLDHNILAEHEVVAGIGPDESVQVGELLWDVPADSEPTTFFLHLELGDREGGRLSTNLYWFGVGEVGTAVSGKKKKKDDPDVADYSNLFAQLEQLKPVTLEYKISQLENQEDSGGGGDFLVTVRNPADTLAFNVGLEADDLPAGVRLLFSDNYFHLPPGEAVEVRVSCRALGIRRGRCRPTLSLSGWNCPQTDISLDIDLGDQSSS
ncbi:glycoside hydrolase family 2 protein [candidate division KSB1 bacterium]